MDNDAVQIEPDPSGTPAPAVDVAVPQSLFGPAVKRKVVFQLPNVLEDWHHRMLLAVQTAKTLGFTVFEIDARDAFIVRPKQRRGPELLNMADIFRIVEAQSRPWEEAKADTPDAQFCQLVTVYTLVIDD